MAKGKLDGVAKKNTIKIKRKGIHSKKKSAILKSSKNYKKRYRAQGR